MRKRFRHEGSLHGRLSPAPCIDTCTNRPGLHSLPQLTLRRPCRRAPWPPRAGSDRDRRALQNNPGRQRRRFRCTVRVPEDSGLTPAHRIGPGQCWLAPGSPPPPRRQPRRLQYPCPHSLLPLPPLPPLPPPLPPLPAPLPLPPLPFSPRHRACRRSRRPALLHDRLAEHWPGARRLTDPLGTALPLGSLLAPVPGSSQNRNPPGALGNASVSPSLSPSRVGSACCYWNGYGTQCSHPAQMLTIPPTVLAAPAVVIALVRAGRDLASTARRFAPAPSRVGSACCYWNGHGTQCNHPA